MDAVYDGKPWQGCLCQGRYPGYLLKKGGGDGAKTDCLKNANCENAEYERDAYFFNSRAGSVTTSLGDCAQFQTFGFHLINLPVGLVG